MGTPKPLYVRYSKLTLTKDDGQGGSTSLDFECSATNIGVTSEGGDTTSLNTLCPEGSFSESAPRTYSLAQTIVQDVESDDSVLWFAWQHEGEVWDAMYYPKTDSQKNVVGNGLKGTVTVSLPDQIGNVEPGNFATSALVWSYQGRPTLVDDQGNPVPVSGGTVALTGVTAGAPGSFQPSNATLPANLAALKADPVVGDGGSSKPSTAWTTGQYVDLADASDAHWDGTAWIVGIAA